MSDTTDFSELVARRVFSLTEMDDRYTREVGCSRTFGELLRLRSEKRWQRIDRAMLAFDFETAEAPSNPADSVSNLTETRTEELSDGWKDAHRLS